MHLNKFKMQIKDVNVYIYKLGLVKYQSESRKFRLFRYLIVSTAILFAIKGFLSIFIYYFKSNQIHRFERFFVWLGDYTFYIPNIRLHLNAIFIVFVLQTTSIQILHNKLIKRNNDFSWMRLFAVIAGKLNPDKIQFTNWNDLIVFIKR